MRAWLALLLLPLLVLPGVAGPAAADDGARTEARAVITRPFAGEGVRVTVGAPEEDDAFLAALDAVRDDRRDGAPPR